MAYPKQIPHCRLQPGWAPVDLSAAANDAVWVDLRAYQHCRAVLMAAAGTAGDDPTITIEQAQDNSGTGAKALNFTEVFTTQGADITAVGQPTKVTQSAANTYTDAASAEVEKVWEVELNADDLDVDNGFTHVRMTVADVGANAQIGTIFYLLFGPRYTSAVPPSPLG